MESWKGEVSIDGKYDPRIDIESGYFLAQKFVSDPVEYLSSLKVQLIEEENYDEVELGMAAIEQVRELCHIVRNENIQVQSKESASVVDAEDLSLEWGQILFSLLKESGYSKESVKTWLLLDDPFTDVDDELNKSRPLNRVLDEVYGED